MSQQLRVLMVTYGSPYPPKSGVSIRDFNLLRQISAKVIVYLCILSTESSIPDLSELRPFCARIEVVMASKRTFLEAIINSLRCWMAGYRLASHPYFYPRLAQKISSIIEEESIDILQIEHSFLVAYRSAIPAGSKCRAILSLHNVGSRQYQRIAVIQSGALRRLIYRLKALLIERMELANAAQFDHCLVVSSEEARLLESRVPAARCSVVENGVDCSAIRPLGQVLNGNDLLFIGVIGYPPNEDAVVYFSKSILPLIRHVIPDARLIVVGDAPSPKVCRLANSESVLVTGAVADPVPYYKRSRVCVVPLRAGGGTRLKILEAMAFERPVVTTSIGCEGLDVVNEQHLLVGDTPKAFAENVIRLLRDPTLSQRLTVAARQLVEDCYDWSRIAPKLLRVYSRLATNDRAIAELASVSSA